MPISNILNVNTPIGVPVSKLGPPPFIPFFPAGGGGRGRAVRGRKTFFNEFFAAGALLGKDLRKRGLQVAKERKRGIGILTPRKRRRKSKKRRR